MKITALLADQIALAELGRRAQRVRLDRNLTQAGLADAAGVSLRTIERFEAAGAAQLVSLVRILRALDLSDRLDRLLPEDGPRPLEQLTRSREGRKRASRPRTGPEPPPSKSWSWGDEQ
jgi:transcriptional regulator with XRE-family HTH domain